MAAITGTLTNNTPSADFTPTEAVSDVYVVKNGGGQLFLRAEVGSLASVIVTEITGSGTIPISTSNPAISYFFQASGQDVDFDYYMGP